jgi:hypothetical protein
LICWSLTERLKLEGYRIVEADAAATALERSGWKADPRRRAPSAIFPGIGE